MKKIKAKVKTKYGVHEIILEKDERGYVVEAPNLDGVLSWGKNIKEAKEMVKEAIDLCIECLVEERIHLSRKRQAEITAKDLLRLK